MALHWKLNKDGDWISSDDRFLVAKDEYGPGWILVEFGIDGDPSNCEFTLIVGGLGLGWTISNGHRMPEWAMAEAQQLVDTNTVGKAKNVRGFH